VNCKLCDNILFVQPHSTRSELCDCQHYFVIIDEGKNIISETLIAGNFCLILFPQFEEASILEKGSADVLGIFQLKELTHELAVQWVNKLKVYVLFS
jgi:hypothetical protein